MFGRQTHTSYVPKESSLGNTCILGNIQRKMKSEADFRTFRRKPILKKFFLYFSIDPIGNRTSDLSVLSENRTITLQTPRGLNLFYIFKYNSLYHKGYIGFLIDNTKGNCFYNTT